MRDVSKTIKKHLNELSSKTARNAEYLQNKKIENLRSQLYHGEDVDIDDIIDQEARLHKFKQYANQAEYDEKNSTMRDELTQWKQGRQEYYNKCKQYYKIALQYITSEEFIKNILKTKKFTTLICTFINDLKDDAIWETCEKQVCLTSLFVNYNDKIYPITEEPFSNKKSRILRRISHYLQEKISRLSEFSYKDKDSVIYNIYTVISDSWTVGRDKIFANIDKDFNHFYYTFLYKVCEYIESNEMLLNNILKLSDNEDIFE